MIEKSLFVYGSFTEGMVHFNKIGEYVVHCQAAWALGRAYRLPSGYPVYVSADQGSVPDAEGGSGVRIRGQLVRLHAPELIYTLLDEFHGVSPLAPQKSLFFKQTLKVATETGPIVEALVYAMNPAQLPKGAKCIVDGDWVADLQTNPVLGNSLTERQASYVRRLAASSGREIIPIDMQLYRELMKLELIVDKGRRLALSKLGHEVAKYLSP
jgi:gamma-glutamylcyclotransferase (GGCT)/AIG2-like uncharacterized protein YtfP